MLNVIFVGCALSVAVLFGWSFRWGDNHSPSLWFLRLMMLAMLVNNMTMIVSQWADSSEWSWAPGYLHAALYIGVFPFLNVFAASLMHHAGIRVAHHPIFLSSIWLAVVVLVIYGVWEAIAGQILPSQDLSITDSTATSGNIVERFSYPAIITNLAVIGMSLAIWKVSGWYWLFVAATVFFCLNLFCRGSEWEPVVASIAELGFVSVLLCAERHFNRVRR